VTLRERARLEDVVLWQSATRMPHTNATYCDEDRTDPRLAEPIGLRGTARPPVGQSTVSDARCRKRILLLVI
jgi:hypothetical protein